MKPFLGLVQKEYKHYFPVAVMIAGLLVIAIGVGPLVILNYFGIAVSFSRYTITISFIVLLSIHALFHFFVSLKTDKRQRDVWLHNSQSIEKLIGAKAVYAGLQLSVLITIAFTGFFFCKETLIGTPQQFFVLYVYTLFFAVSGYANILVVSIFFNTLFLQLKKWLGILSYVATGIFICFFFKVMAKLEIDILTYGYISSDWLKEHMPTVVNWDTTTIFSIYIGEEILFILIYLVIFALTCRWFERVMTR